MVIKINLFGLKSSGLAFRSKLASLLHDIRYTPSKSDVDILMIPAIKWYRIEYSKYAMVYVDNVLVISCVPMKTIKKNQTRIQTKRIQSWASRHVPGNITLESRNKGQDQMFVDIWRNICQSRCHKPWINTCQERHETTYKSLSNADKLPPQWRCY